jgi:hypothetical protein
MSIGRCRAGNLAAFAAVPRLELLEAVVAGARGDGSRVEVCILVQRQRIAGVPVAEDVATFAAVVAADKVAEVALAGRVVADGGLSIGLVNKMLVWLWR